MTLGLFRKRNGAGLLFLVTFLALIVRPLTKIDRFFDRGPSPSWETIDEAIKPIPLEKYYVQSGDGHQNLTNENADAVANNVSELVASNKDDNPTEKTDDVVGDVAMEVQAAASSFKEDTHRKEVFTDEINATTCSFPIVSSEHLSPKSILAIPRHNFRQAKQQVLHYIHVPKAGGTALASALAKGSGLCLCRGERARTFQHHGCRCIPRRMKNEQTMQAVQTRLTSGWECGRHANLYKIDTCRNFRGLVLGGSEEVDAVKDADVLLITALRDPLDRSLSEYWMCGKKGKCWDWTYQNETRLSLEEYASLDPGKYLYQNRQVKMLSGCRVDKTVWSDEEKARKCVERAKRNVVERFAFVLLHDSMEYFLRLLGFLLFDGAPLHLNLTQEDVHKTGAKYSPKNWEERNVSQQVKDVLREANRYDYELYNFSKDFLCEKYGL